MNKEVQEDSQPRGRKNRDLQEAVVTTAPLRKREAELVRLHQLSIEASDALSDAIKKVAEDSGLLASVVRKYVTARAKENVPEKKREAEQLSLVFGELGE